MAKFYDTKTGEVVWNDIDLLAPVEDAYFELSGYLAMKKLDGHDRTDQWYMLVHQKLQELISALDMDPTDIDQDRYKEIT